MEELLACRACLATGVKLHNMRSNHLVNAYENLTGVKIASNSFPEHMCSYCTALLMKSVSFKDKCMKALELLNDTVLRTGMLTAKSIASIDRSYIMLPYICQRVVLQIKEEKIKEEDDGCIVLDDANDMNSIDDDFRDSNNTPDIKIKANESSEDEPLAKVKRKKRKKSSKMQKNQKEFKHVIIDTITLTKEEQMQEILARKLTLNYQNSLYKCDKCFKGFITETTYKNHMFTHDPSSGALECAVCLARRPSARALRSHLLLHARRFVCRVCSHVTSSKHRAVEHAHWHDGRTFRCTICGSTFTKSTSYLTHMRLRHATEHRCSICGEAFLGVNGLNIHKKRAHRLESDYPCGGCGAVFRNEGALQMHGKEGCGSLRPCPECGQGFLSEDLLGEHLTQHRAELKCQQCPRSFRRARSLAAHHQRAHLGVRVPGRGRSVAAVCEVCGHECPTRASLVLHQRVHSGEKPFQCPQCPKRFSVCQRLQIHLRTHTGERPFKCGVCPKAFKHKAALNRHDRVHTGEKPYTCSQCDKAFSQSNSMKLHVRTVHLKIPPPYRRKKNA